MSVCGKEGSVWRKAMGNDGACNFCGEPVPPMSQEEEALWHCSPNGDISLNLSGVPDARKCMSWTTEGGCEFKQKDLRSIQATLESEGCDGIWAAPLWIAPDNWAFPQHATGEVDIFERGCDKKDGYLLSFGEGDPWIIHDAWGEQDKPTASTRLTAFMQFDPAQDKVSIYSCPFGANPIDVGPEAAGCKLTRSYDGYYRDTREQTHDGNDYMHLVSDVWNKCTALPCGNALERTDCRFNVSNIRLGFSEESAANGQTPFKVGCSAGCQKMWHK
jgi:hypothetical protein